MTGRIKVVVGILLIILSAALMFFWETKGRAMLLNEDVVVTTTSLEAGELLTGDKVKIASVSKDSIMENCLTPDMLNEYIGQTLKYSINVNSQISVNSFISGENPVTMDMSLFKIEPQWIRNISSSIRKADRIFINAYCSGLPVVNLGTYYVAFVKDSSGRELIESTGSLQPEILKRTTGLYVPSYIEIAAKLSDYTTILSYVEQGYSLILVQEGVSELEY